MMNGGSISRKPIDRKPVGQPTSGSTPKQVPLSPVSPVMSLPTPPAYTAVQQPAPVYGISQAAPTSHATNLQMMTPGPSPVMAPAPAGYRLGQNYPPATPLPVHTPALASPAATVRHSPTPATPYQNPPLYAPTPLPTKNGTPAVLAAAATTPASPVTAAAPQPTYQYMIPSHHGQAGVHTMPTAGLTSLPTTFPNVPPLAPNTVATSAPIQPQPGIPVGNVTCPPPNYGHNPGVVRSASMGGGTMPAVTAAAQERTPPGNPSAQACASCKNVIAPNVSVFCCLICSTAGLAVDICVWCYTTGAAATAHAHDTSYLVTDSDIPAQSPVAGIPLHIWTVRKNASGRLWYKHNQTGFKTHLQPLISACDETGPTGALPPGWEEVRSLQGQLFYFHAPTGNKTWERPKSVLPPGWKMKRTPDGTPFYVHEALQLSSWDRPGEQPKPRPTKRPAAVPSSSAVSVPVAAGAVVAAASNNNKYKPGKGSNTGANIAMAASVANNMAKLSAASDMTPSGILTATVAAAKLTGIGVKVAGKKMGRLGRMKHLSTATHLLNAAATLTGDGDGDTAADQDDDEDGGGDVVEVEEVNEEEQQQQQQQQQQPGEVTSPGSEYVQYGAPSADDSSGQFTQPDTYCEPQPQQLYPQQPSYMYDPPSGTPAQVPQPQEFVPPAPPPVVITNVNITVEENSLNELNMHNTTYGQANLAPQTTELAQINHFALPQFPAAQQVPQSVPTSGATITDLAWADPSYLYQPQAAPEQGPPPPAEIVVPLQQMQPPPIAPPPPEMVQQFQYADPASVVGLPPPVIDGTEMSSLGDNIIPDYSASIDSPPPEAEFDIEYDTTYE